MPVLPCFCEHSVEVLYLNIIALHTIGTNDCFAICATAIELNVIWYAIYAGFWRNIQDVREKKEAHTWAIQVLNELVKQSNLYKYVHNGRQPRSSFEKDENPFTVPETQPDPDTDEKKNAQQSGRKETPILVAAKMGVKEMVEKILDAFPVAIQDLDSDKKNVVLLAIENRHTSVYELLLNRRVLGETIFWQVDNQGNSALHLAAMYGDHRPWLIPGAALQMQWEIKWFQVCMLSKLFSSGAGFSLYMYELCSLKYDTKQIKNDRW